MISLNLWKDLTRRVSPMRTSVAVIDLSLCLVSVRVPASRRMLSPAFELETSEPFRTIKSFIYSPKSLNVTPLPALLSVDVCS